MMEALRMGVIGIGTMGSAHAACIAEHQIQGLTLTAVCDLSEEKCRVFSEKYPSVLSYGNYHQLLESGHCDGVIIAVPHPLHAEIAIEAFAHGLHVLLEKPADIAVSRVRKLNEAAAQSGKVFSMMFNQRTHPLFARARQILKSGELGELKRSVWMITNWFRTQHYYNSGGWRATWSGEGGGVLLNQAPHNLDLWQWICGMPTEITAFCDVAKYHHIEVEDDATIFARYPNGATGVFMTSTGEYPGTNRLEISGDLGKIVLENGILKWYKLKKPIHTAIIDSEYGFSPDDCQCEEIRQEAPETAHRGILQNFANAILHGEELIAPGADGLWQLTLSNAAYLSQWQGNRPVSIPFEEALYDRLLAEKAAHSQFQETLSGNTGSMSYLPKWEVKW